QIIEAELQAIDYIGMGPIYATTTKPHEPCRGIELLDQAKPSLPSYAIGGMSKQRILSIKDKIPHGVAVAGAICSADDPQAACRELLEIFAH
ncbi:MAG: thiamine phosphate synthase, partial [Planctomycetes bacterium]|nr:thiamine phosphate synthase [Planctomycetota bacterium]